MSLIISRFLLKYGILETPADVGIGDFPFLGPSAILDSILWVFMIKEVYLALVLGRSKSADDL